MSVKDLSEYKRKYAWYRHHAWAGAILLSVVLAARLFIRIDSVLLLPVVLVLIVYIVVALVFTYRYSAGLSVEDTKVEVPSSVESERVKAQVKLEKKKAKASVKAKKKEGKTL